MDLEEAQKRLATELEAKAKLTETNQSLQKVKGTGVALSLYSYK